MLPVTDVEPEVLRLRGLDVDRPDGVRVLAGVDLTLRRGEVVALLGGSGSGKSTLLSCIEDPAKLTREGFAVRFEARVLSAEIGIVPQRGALFDHLTVAGNLRLALRNAAHAGEVTDAQVETWLRRMHLPVEWASNEQGTDRLSGGEAQRIAVARTLAGGRDLLFLDEPSVGIDPYRVLVLATLLREQIRDRNAAAIVITHDLTFAAAFADRFWFMDRVEQAVVELDVGTISPDITRSADEHQRIETVVRKAVVERLEQDKAPAPGRRTRNPWAQMKRAAAVLVEPFAVPVEVARRGPVAVRRGLRDFAEVAPVVLRQTLLRPAAFFAIVSTLLGYSVLYIFHHAFSGGDLALRDEFVFSMIGARHIIALAPPLSGILFCATSGNAVTAWLGGISLTKQGDALEALGIERERYLWLPAWMILSMSSLVLAAIFVGGMVGGGALYIHGYGAPWSEALGYVTAQLLDPESADIRLLARAAFLLAIYAVGISADVVAKGSRAKRSSDAVTVAMVASVMASTLWIVLLEMATLPLVFG